LIVKVLLFLVFGAIGGSMGKKLGNLTLQSTNEEVMMTFDKIKILQLVDVIVGALIILLAILLRYNPT